ncbi:hypothetical protein BDV26DRAFT_255192 [Aspergillus bertholletiae]|uniref:Uncharacterized protein n=1 Tax=Aspergillus bertholletiae TaxID=1226010 RepID=A0A5N7BIU8_9EURO|nr:hypothetical protein BDV26DRAFT_255192 [Aspergillus bertholletiae]
MNRNRNPGGPPEERRSTFPALHFLSLVLIPEFFSWARIRLLCIRLRCCCDFLSMASLSDPSSRRIQSSMAAMGM